MVALKHILLASLAAFAVASPASATGGKPNSSATGVAPHGKPSETPVRSGVGTPKHGGSPSNGKGQTGYADDKYKTPAGDHGGSEKHSKHQARSWQRPTGVPADGESGSHDEGPWQQSGTGQSGDAPKHNQQHPRDEDAKHKFRGTTQGKGDDGTKDRSPGKEGDGGRIKRPNAREAAPMPIDIPEDDPHLLRLQQWAKLSGKDGVWNETEHEGKELHTRAGVKGIYECMHHNFVAPCKWTELKQPSQCYNNIYGLAGSMGPDKGLCCKIYEMRDCNDDGWQTVNGFHYPGIADYGISTLLTENAIADEGIVSTKCEFKSENDCKATSH